MNESVVKSIAVIVSQLILTIWCACNQAQDRIMLSSPSFSSPAAVLDYYRHAFAEGEWRKCYASLTPDSQKYVLFDLAFECMESGSDKAAEICRSHGLGNEALKEEFDKRRKQSEGPGTTNDGNKRINDELLRREIVASLVRDKATFYEAACSFLQSRQQNPPVGVLSQVRIDGDTAIGIVQISVTQLSSLRGESSKTIQSKGGQTIKFRKVGGSWLIDML
jgi:hypothetical protein